MDQEPDARDDQGEQHRELVQLERRVHPQAADRHPLPVALDHRPVQLGAEHAHEVDHRQQECDADDARTDDRGDGRPARRHERGHAVDDEAGEGEERDRPEQRRLELGHATTAAG